MASAIVLGLLSVLAVSLVSLVGAVSLTFRSIYKHSVLMGLVAVAAGTLIGDSFLHLLPEAVEAQGGFNSNLGWAVLGGFLLMFVMEVGLRWDHSHIEAAAGHEAHGHQESHSLRDVEPFGWMNLISDGIHNLLDGAVIMAAYLVEPTLGLVTTIAVAAHEVPQELGDFAVLLRSGMKEMQALLFNLGSALIALLGAGLVLLLDLHPETISAWALPAIAGAFLYIAAADLVPELHHHTRGRDGLIIFIGLALGLLIMGLLLGLEGALFVGEQAHEHG